MNPTETRWFRRHGARMVLAAVGAWLAAAGPAAAAAEPALRKIGDVVLYEDPKFYAAFPSVVRRPDGELLVAFRRAPSRVALGENRTTHVDPNSYLVAVRSRDGGASWSREPELVYAHAFGGSQDPCLLQLRDGTLLCASYGWGFFKPEAAAKLPATMYQIQPGVAFLGGYLVRSQDGGRTWQGPIYPPPVAAEQRTDPYGRRLPAYNRGAMAEGRSGRIYWSVASSAVATPRRTANYLLVSDDRGATWTELGTVAADPEVTFNEASVYETPKGDVVVFLRTADFEDQACLARSTDGGKTFQPWQGMGFKGHPLQALRLRDDRVLLVYGYRHKPYGIRARVLNAECTDFATAPEFVLRDDGGTTDLGYPWSARLDGDRVLVVYYFNREGGVRHIAGTVVEIP